MCTDNNETEFYSTKGRMPLILSLSISSFFLVVLCMTITFDEDSINVLSSNYQEIIINFTSSEKESVESKKQSSTQRLGVLSKFKTSNMHPIIESNNVKTKARFDKTSKLHQKSLSVISENEFHPTISNLRSKKYLKNPERNKAIKERSNNGDNRPPQYGLGSASNPKPPYPYLARKNGWQGKVLLKVRVDKLGRPIYVWIQRPSGYAVLDNAARNTVKNNWKFKPSLRFGLKVEGSILVPIRFELLNN